jgi:hypothetical protein
MQKPTLQALLDAKAENPEKADKFFGIGKEPDAKWLKVVAPGLEASQKLLDEYWVTTEFDDMQAAPAAVHPIADADELSRQVEALRDRVQVEPDAPAHVIIAAALAGKWRRKAIMLCPMSREMNANVHYAHMATMRQQPWLGYFQDVNSIIQKARNKCADYFLKTEAEFAFWVDSDTIPPFGNPGFFYDKLRLAANQEQLPERFARFKALDRLVSHGKSIVGGFYQQRGRFGKITSPLDLRPGGDKEGIIKATRRKAQDKIVPVEWCATGCLLVHRKVFEDIMARHPELASKHEGGPFNFFGHNVDEGGEDAHFGKLAAEAGHQSYLDLGCWCAHVGAYAFWPEEVSQ